MIKFLVMDVDGTLTDGKVYMGSDGEAIKAFDIKDGCGLKVLLPQYGIIPIIITARRSVMLEHRCKELGITEIHQGISEKIDCLKGILERYSLNGQTYTLANVAYIGDDILDLQCLQPIKEAGGIAGCPSNAVKEVLSVCDYIASHKGGEGAVRDFIEYLIDINKEKTFGGDNLYKRCMDAVEYLNSLNVDNLAIGRYDVDERFFYNVMEYETTGELDKPFESHRKYVDIQMLLAGEEIMQVVDVNRLQLFDEYDADKERTLYYATQIAGSVLLRPGSTMVLYPNDAHRSMSYDGKTTRVKKIVGKVKIM